MGGGGRAASCLPAPASSRLSQLPATAVREGATPVPRVVSFPGPLQRGEGLTLWKGCSPPRLEGNESRRLCLGLLCFLSPHSGLALVLGIFLWLPDGHQKMSETSPGLLPHLIQEASLCQSSWDSGPAVHLPGCLPSSVPRGGCYLFPGEAGRRVFNAPPDNQALLLSVVFRGTHPCSLASTRQSSRNLPVAVNKTGRRRTWGEGGQDRKKGAEPAGGHYWRWALGSRGPGILGLPQHTPLTRGLSSRNLLSPSSQPEVQG